MILEFEAYHGTTKSSAESIIKYGVKIKKYSFNVAQLQSVPGDLGMGFYTYKDSYENAWLLISRFQSEVSIIVIAPSTKLLLSTSI